LYGITSERKLLEELRMHLAWRWFTGLGFDQEIPHHSTFSKNRHGRFQESKLFEQLLEQIVARCLEAGLVEGDNRSVDGSFVEANANNGSRIPREQLTEVAHVKHNVGQYLAELEHQAITLIVKSGLFRGHLKPPDLEHLGAKVVAQSLPLCHSFSSFPFGSCASCAESFCSASRDFVEWGATRLTCRRQQPRCHSCFRQPYFSWAQGLVCTEWGGGLESH